MSVGQALQDPELAANKLTRGGACTHIGSGYFQRHYRAGSSCGAPDLGHPAPAQPCVDLHAVAERGARCDKLLVTHGREEARAYCEP